VFWVGTAHAGRKRVVVLDFTGPKAEKFHDDVVKLVKKQHTVVKTEDWNAAAEEMDAGKVTEKNVKKLAKKLKVDAVITGKIDKRRDQYIIKLKLRSGATGEIQGNPVQTQAEGPRIDSQAQRDIKDELIAQIADLESVGGGGDEPDEEKPKKKKGDDEGDEEKPKKSGFGGKKDDEEDRSKKDDEEKARKEEEKARKEEEKARKEEEKRKRKSEEEEALSTKKDEEEERPRKKKRKADLEEEEGGEVSDEAEEEEEPGDAKLNLSPGKRAVDAVLGLSFTRRNLAFTYASDLGKVPPGYRQTIPVAGAIVDLTVYPMAFGHKKKDITTNIGLNILYDQVLVINSRKSYLDGQGTPQTANLTTKEYRWLVGGVFRYPLGQGAKAPVVGGSLSFGKQMFTIGQALPNMEATDIPNVSYTMITPSVLVRFPITDKINANLDAGLHAITNTGAIQTSAQYGAATVLGYDLEVGGDYMVTKNIFARASIRYQSIGFTFKGDPTSMTNTRDTDPDQDVTGAKDTYFGGTATVGYVY
jgi:hypothetical protein